MTKRFCDLCGKEINGTGCSLIKGEFRDSEGSIYEATLGVNLKGKAYAGDFCRPCMIDAAMSCLDDRPKAASRKGRGAK